MFTGIIRELGTVERITRAQGITRLAIRAPGIASRVQRLESVSVNGVCLSVVDIRQQMLVFEMITETQRLTTLAALRTGDRVHLEPSQRPGHRPLGVWFLDGRLEGIPTGQCGHSGVIQALSLW